MYRRRARGIKFIARDVKVRSTMNHFGSSELDFYNSFVINKIIVERKVEHTGSK
jgi:hypothetical protein